VLCLAIGIGLNTMMFSVTDGVLVQPLPYQDPDTIVVLHTTQKEQRASRQPVVARAAGLAGARALVQRDRRDPVPQLHRQRRRRSRSLSGAAISHELFPLLGERRSSGAASRPTTIARARAGGPHLRRSLEAPLQRDPSIVGRAIQDQSRRTPVIGRRCRADGSRFPEILVLVRR
jgi:hypothetical protein